jgi:superoxide dismutase, Cu-Zn family
MTRAAGLVTIALVGLVGSSACSRAAAGPEPALVPLASGTIRNAAGERIGVAALSDTAGVLILAISVGQLTPGAHGLHFHQEATCTPPSFTSAGPHYNPAGRQHGRLNPEGPHLGDLPNLIVGPDGSADPAFELPRELAGLDSTSLVKAGGALVVHAGPDDERTDPTGNSGERVGCAVIEPG